MKKDLIIQSADQVDSVQPEFDKKFIDHYKEAINKAIAIQAKKNQRSEKLHRKLGKVV